MKKKILITGAGSDIGLMTALEFIKKDHFVYLNIRNIRSKKLCLQFLNKHEVNSSRYKFYIGDISNNNFVEKMFGKIKDTNGYLDLLINNAAIIDNKSSKMDINNFKKIFTVNFFGILNCCIKFLKIKQKKTKMIINISSDVALRGSYNLPAYAASKAAIDNTILSLSKLFDKSNLFSVILNPVQTKKTIKNLRKSKKKLNRSIMPHKVAKGLYSLFYNHKSYSNVRIIQFKDIKKI